MLHRGSARAGRDLPSLSRHVQTYVEFLRGLGWDQQRINERLALLARGEELPADFPDARK
jgi:hypothetical protein